MALNDSDNADLGFSKTDKLELPYLIPTTPIKGILVNLLISSVLRMEFSRKNIIKIITKGISSPKNNART